MAKYDLPAMIDYVVKLTKQPKIFYVGHSQGYLNWYLSSFIVPAHQHHPHSTSLFLYNSCVSAHVYCLICPCFCFYRNSWLFFRKHFFRDFDDVRRVVSIGRLRLSHPAFLRFGPSRDHWSSQIGSHLNHVQVPKSHRRFYVDIRGQRVSAKRHGASLERWYRQFCVLLLPRETFIGHSFDLRNTAFSFIYSVFPKKCTKVNFSGKK